jgi:DNA invertase Pin-like site-specific DNA recombinase
MKAVRTKEPRVEPHTSTVAVPYLRTSTDDKGQVPGRQLEVIEPWAHREGVGLLDAVVDEGSSASKLNPFERPKFIEACKRAVAGGAVAIVVECTDRFSRQGSKIDGWAEVELDRRFNLKLYRADKTVDEHGSLTGDMADNLRALLGREWVKTHASKVMSGMKKAKKDGKRVGRPAKPLTVQELAQVKVMRGEGEGWRSIAHAISTGRGAFKVADPARRRTLTVSHSHVRRVMERRA